ncbi:aspartyl-phosphate phosphatase Spo0E family protein [Cohnella sp. 56]|uniref:aspartyl-phosphate phosphatase Spo0E family protein n=1 Tax=Cohnella sp. 56 TaxID=3113722 RepID=UPI0030E9CDD8
MKEWTEQIEMEKQKLNRLGAESLAQGIPLSENDALQAQSRKVDELIVRLHGKSAYKLKLDQ